MERLSAGSHPRPPRRAWDLLSAGSQTLLGRPLGLQSLVGASAEQARGAGRAQEAEACPRSTLALGALGLSDHRVEPGW